MKIFFSIAFIIVLSSCAAIKPDAPTLPSYQLSSTPPADSKIDIPLTIDLSQELNDFTAKIPLQITGDGTAGPAQYRWQIKRRPFDLSLSGNSFNIIDSAYLTAGGYLKNPFNSQWKNICSCNADAILGLTAGFNLLRDYSLDSQASLTRFELNLCDLKVFNFDLAPILKAKALEKVNGLIQSLNQQLKQYNFRSLFQPEWSALNQPVKVADIGYIVLNPSAIRIGHLSGSGHTLSFTAGITAKPVFYLSDPGRHPVSTLPNISTDGGGNGFNLNLDVHLNYKPLNELLKNEVADKKITDGTKGYMTIKDAELYGSGNNHLLIKIKFSGKEGVFPYHGVIYFTCLPHYDVNSGDFYINDIDFDVSTRKKLEEGPAVWILNSALKKYVGSQVKFNISSQINSAKGKLDQAINQQVSPGISLAGNVSDLSLTGILPNSGDILVRISAAGKLTMKIN